MNWLQGNWGWLIVIGLFVVFHMFGHRHGHGRGHERGNGRETHQHGGGAASPSQAEPVDADKREGSDAGTP